MTKRWGSRSSSSRSARSRASGKVITAISGALLEDVGEELGGRRLRRGVREGHRLFHEVVDVLLDLLHVVLGQHPRLERPLSEEDDRVAQLLALDLLLGAIHFAGGIAHAEAPD